MFDLLLELVSFLIDIPSRKPTENDIRNNINQLKKDQWFLDFLKDETYKKHIIHNKKVRQTIGKFKTGKIQQERYNLKYQEKLYTALQKAVRQE